jgi:hypothetical protein
MNSARASRASGGSLPRSLIFIFGNKTENKDVIIKKLSIRNEHCIIDYSLNSYAYILTT